MGCGCAIVDDFVRTGWDYWHRHRKIPSRAAHTCCAELNLEFMHLGCGPPCESFRALGNFRAKTRSRGCCTDRKQCGFQLRSVCFRMPYTSVDEGLSSDTAVVTTMAVIVDLLSRLMCRFTCDILQMQVYQCGASSESCYLKGGLYRIGTLGCHLKRSVYSAGFPRKCDMFGWRGE